ncbi:MAG: allantoate amidohydrolase [Pseudomonadaceae bacterium]|nr:allantoate amidohydrolase [Pseudomonadaceae bacterium]
MSGVADRVLARCDELAGLSSMADGICRVYLSEQHRVANELVAGWMRAAGLDVCFDAVGNVCGRLGNPALPTLIVGSHLDTIPDAGRYDGILGVLLGIELAERFRDEPLPFALEVIGFGEEEGVRFGTTLMTSRALAGTWDHQWFDLCDADGVSLHDAMERFGLNPAETASAARDTGGLLGFLEVHIEQGPVLEAEGLPLALVTSIAGARRFEARVQGMAGHAGTMPMAMRRDALAAASEIVLAIEAIAASSKDGLVATVGQIEALPGGVNVVPGAAVFSLDVRAGEDHVRDVAIDEIRARADAICERRNVLFDMQQTHIAGSAACDAGLLAHLAAGLEANGVVQHRMASGAGHDAMAMAELCPVAMLFVRCADGISHHPEESISPADVAVAFDVLCSSVRSCAESFKE